MRVLMLLPLLVFSFTGCMKDKVAAPGPSPNAVAADPAVPKTTAEKIYTDGALADPDPKAEDLGMAQPGEKITIDSDK